MTEGASQLAIIFGAFIVTAALTVFTRLHPMAVGCLIPIAAALGVTVYLAVNPPTSSTASLAIPFMAIFAAMGSIPAAFLAGFWTGRLK